MPHLPPRTNIPGSPVLQYLKVSDAFLHERLCQMLQDELPLVNCTEVTASMSGVPAALRIAVHGSVEIFGYPVPWGIAGSFPTPVPAQIPMSPLDTVISRFRHHVRGGASK